LQFFIKSAINYLFNATYHSIIPIIKEYGYELLEKVDNYRGTIYAKKMKS